MFQICHYPYGSYRAWFKRSPGRGCRPPEVACFGCRLIVFRLKILFRVWPRGKHLSTSAKNFFPMLVLTLSLNGELNQRMLRSRFLLWPVLGGKGGGGQVSACNCSHSHPELSGRVVLHGRRIFHPTKMDDRQMSFLILSFHLPCIQRAWPQYHIRSQQKNCRLPGRHA